VASIALPRILNLVPDRKPGPIAEPAEKTPEAARRKEGDDQRQQAENDHIARAEMAEEARCEEIANGRGEAKQVSRAVKRPPEQSLF
jgi:hypothetical protein